MQLLPQGATPDAAVLLQTRGIRAFGDGLVSVVLSAYLLAVGLSSARIGVIVSVTLLGSAALTLAVGLRAERVPRRRLLQLVSVLMMATGIGFALFTGFWPLALVGMIGTLNPSSGDVSVFLPTEQALLPATVSDDDRTAVFARYSLIGSLLAAFGALCAGVPEWLGARWGWTTASSLRIAFIAYACLALVVLVRYRSLSPAVETTTPVRRAPLTESREIVYRLAALFSLDAFGGGFVITAMLVLWLDVRFDLSVAVSGAVFFWAGVLSAFSALVAARIAKRIGLVRTMVFTHLPANGLLILTAFMPNAVLAVACLLARSALSQMDVPAAHVVRDGGREPGRAPGCRQRHQRAAQPRRCAPAIRRRLDAARVVVRVAARDRRRCQGRLRPAAAPAVPQSATARGAARPRSGGDAAALRRDDNACERSSAGGGDEIAVLAVADRRRRRRHLPVTQEQPDEQPHHGDRPEQRARREHCQRRCRAGAGDRPSGAEQRAAHDVVALDLRARELELSAVDGLDATAFENHEQRQRHADRETHQQEHVELLEPQRLVDRVEFVELGRCEHEAEAGAEQPADQVHPVLHRPSTPFCKVRSPRLVNDVRTNVTTIAVPTNVAVAAQLAGERWAVPQIP